MLSTTQRRILAANLERLRGDKTQSEIARISGVYLRNYTRLERGEQGQNPTLATLEQIARALGVETWQLLKRHRAESTPVQDEPKETR